MPETKESTKALKQAVEGLHNCKAKYKKETHVKETFEGQLVWEGDVYIFDLKDHPTAKLAYAWSSPVEGLDKRRFYAVLHAPPVKSAQDAVRASIANDYKQKRPS
jgi:hypothetical protein